VEAFDYRAISPVTALMPFDALGLGEGAKEVLVQGICFFTGFVLTAVLYEKVKEVTGYALESTPNEIPSYERSENLREKPSEKFGEKGRQVYHTALLYCFLEVINDEIKQYFGKAIISDDKDEDSSN
jgi:hypothetical protein